jgi:hypothetical protein
VKNKNITVRIESALLKKISKIAKRNYRTVNKQIAYMLEKELKEKAPKKRCARCDCVIDTKEDYYQSQDGNYICNTCGTEHLSSSAYGFYEHDVYDDPDQMRDDDLTDVELYEQVDGEK